MKLNNKITIEGKMKPIDIIILALLIVFILCNFIPIVKGLLMLILFLLLCWKIGCIFSIIVVIAIILCL